MAKVKVMAKKGLRVFFPRRVVAAPGARTLVLEGEAVIEVDGDERFVAKRIRVGELVVIKQTKKPKAEAKPAGKNKKAESKE